MNPHTRNALPPQGSVSTVPPHPQKRNKKGQEENKEKDTEVKKETKSHEKLTDREKEFLYKKKLKTKADLLVEK